MMFNEKAIEEVKNLFSKYDSETFGDMFTRDLFKFLWSSLKDKFDVYQRAG